MREIYTSVAGLKIRGVIVHDIAGLRIAGEIRARQSLLKRQATLPENMSSHMLEHFDEKPIRQAYFRIRKRSYFLDFFFPSRMLAIEIDGSVHRTQKEYDRRRDADFRSIGIRTIRVKNKDVMNGKLYEKIFKKLYKSN